MWRGVIGAVLVTALDALSAQVPPPPPPPGTAAPLRPVTTVLTGRVTDAVTRQPIPNAHLSTGPNVVGSPVVLTDGEGRFSLPAPSGRFVAIANKTGYAREPIQVTAGAPIEIALQPAAAISGRVIDESGDPVLGARVVVERLEDANRRGMTLGAFETDDRGEYRIGGLPAATVIVSVNIRGEIVVVQTDNRTFAEPSSSRVFFPNASTDSDAERMTLKPGDERGGVDFIVPVKDASNQPFSVTQLAGISVPGTQDPPDSRGVVRGRIVDAEGRAIAYAQIRLAFNGGRGMPPLAARTTRTDPAGAFEFTDVPAAEMRLTASRAGYFPTGESAGSSNPLRFTLQTGQTRDRIELKLAAWSVVEGRVLDERGDPIMDASVQLLQPHYEGGRRVLTGVLPPRLTDDRGQYRIYGVVPGSYLVSSSIGQVAAGDVPGYARSFFPGTDDVAAAQHVTAEAGRANSGTDISLVRAPTAHVSGALLDANGRPTTGGAVALTPAGSAVGVRVGARIAEGSFEFPNVPSGRYVASMSRGRLNRWTEGDFAALLVTVADADVTGLVLQATPGSRVGGRIIYNSSDPSHTPPANGLEIVPVPVDPALAPWNSIATARLFSSSQFELNGITGIRRLQVVHAPPGWMVESMLVNGIDVLDQPLTFGGEQRSISVDVTMTDRVSMVKGAVTDDRSRAVAGVDVLVFSRDRRTWYMGSRFLRRARTNTEGVFAIEGLPEDGYYVVAAPQLPADGEEAWQEPEYLDAISARASTVTVTAGNLTNLNLRVTPR